MMKIIIVKRFRAELNGKLILYSSKFLPAGPRWMRAWHYQQKPAHHRTAPAATVKQEGLPSPRTHNNNGRAMGDNAIIYRFVQQYRRGKRK